MKRNLMKGMTLWTCLFAAISMGAILYVSATKVVTISNVTQDEVDMKGRKEQMELQGTSQMLTFQLGEADTSYLRIPLPEGISSEAIVIENHYVDQELYVFLKGAEESFYRDNAVSGERKNIRQGSFEKAEDGVRLKFELKGVFECQSILEDGNLYIDFLSPREVYDKIVVIDPAHGGEDKGEISGSIWEKNINLGIARKLKERLDKTDIKVYYTRMDDVGPEEEKRVALANETRADMYIRIEADYQKESSWYGTTALYNGSYFIPGFGSVELADVLERQVVTSIKGKALGLAEAEDGDYAILHITIPAAAIKVGCLSNKQEAGLLQREEYQDRIAEGIYNAILQVYEEE